MLCQALTKRSAKAIKLFYGRIKYFIDIFLIIKPATDAPLKVFYVEREKTSAVSVALNPGESILLASYFPLCLPPFAVNKIIIRQPQ